MEGDKKYLILIFCIYITLTLPFLTTFPPVDNMGDESWMMNISEEILSSGRPVASMHKGTPISEKPQIITAWIYNGTLAGIFYVFGVSLWAGRFLSFLCGLVVLILTYYFGKILGTQKVGFTAALLLATSPAFLWHSREIRPEMMLLAFTTASLYFFYLAWQYNKYIFFFLSGLVSSLSVEVHPNGSLFALSIFIVYFVLYRKKILSMSTLYLLFGFSIGFVIWIIFNYLPYSTSSFETIHKKYLPPIGRIDIHYLLIKGIKRFFSLVTPDFLNLWIRTQYFSDINIGFLYFALFLTFCSLAFGKQQKKIVFLLSMIILPLWLSTFLIGAWNWFHFSLFLVLVSAIFSISIYDISEKLTSQKFKTIFSYGIIFIYLTIGTIDIMKKNIEMKNYNFNAFKNEISRHVPSDATVMGSGIYYFALRERKDVKFMTYLFIMERCPDIEEEINRYNIDFILVDEIFINISTMWCSSIYSNKIKEYINKKTSPFYTINIKYPNSLTHNRFLSEVTIRKVIKNRDTP
jgi:4-amino-4-deoxy-L-arabinose transferase-like glycosyltransferase